MNELMTFEDFLEEEIKASDLVRREEEKEEFWNFLYRSNELNPWNNPEFFEIPAFVRKENYKFL